MNIQYIKAINSANFCLNKLCYAFNGYDSYTR